MFIILELLIALLAAGCFAVIGVRGVFMLFVGLPLLLLACYGFLTLPASSMLAVLIGLVLVMGAHGR